jgi:hypothetical protein
LSLGSGNYFTAYVDANVSTATPIGVILQVSGTTVTSPTTEISITTNMLTNFCFNAEVDPTDNSKIICAYGITSTRYLGMRQLTVSGSTITVGAEHTDSGTNDLARENGYSVIPLNSTTSVVIYGCNPAAGGSIYPSYKIATNSSGAFTFGTLAVISSTTERVIYARNNLATPSSLICTYTNSSGTRYARAKVGTINSALDSISFNTETQLSTTAVDGTWCGVAQQSDSEGHFAYIDEASTNNNAFLVLGKTGATTSNLTATNFVGIADAAISSSATGTVVVQGGTITGLSSLTTGSKYYVQGDGTITTVSSSVNAGLAISTTSLLLNGDS